jgi:hypothetical protein
LTLEVAQVTTGMEIALGAETWEVFRGQVHQFL